MRLVLVAGKDVSSLVPNQLAGKHQRIERADFLFCSLIDDLLVVIL
jgi:hypothetical protein